MQKTQLSDVLLVFLPFRFDSNHSVAQNVHKHN